MKAGQRGGRMRVRVGAMPAETAGSASQGHRSPKIKCLRSKAEKKESSEEFRRGARARRETQKRVTGTGTDRRPPSTVHADSAPSRRARRLAKTHM